MAFSAYRFGRCDTFSRGVDWIAGLTVSLPYLLSTQRTPWQSASVEAVLEASKPCIHNFEGFLFGLFRIKAFDKVGFTEQKSKSINFAQRFFQRVIGVNREVRRYNGERRTVFDVRT